MGSAASVPADKHIVIIGGGYGGSTAGVQLMAIGANFTIINPTDSFHHNVASVRAACIKDYAKVTFIPLKETFGDKFKQGKVVDIQPKDKKVVLESGEEISYDALIVATGTSGAFPNKVDVSSSEAIALYNKMAEKVEKSEKIAIIGGGPTGTEIAAEVASKYPEKSVTLINSSEILVHPKSNDNFQKKLKGILTRMKIKLVLGEKVTNFADIPEEGVFTLVTDKGTEIEADCIFTCLGLKVNASAYQNSLASAMEENGALKVNEFFEVEGFEDIYAIGDATNFQETKLALYAGEHAKLLTKNLARKFNSQALSPYKPAGAPVLLVICLGPNSGLGQTKGGYIIGEWISAKLKSGNLFVNRFWSDMKQKVPALQ